MKKKEGAGQKQKRGFAALDPERRKEIAAMGGRKAHELGKAHQFDTFTGAWAGRKGGLTKRDNDVKRKEDPV